MSSVDISDPAIHAAIKDVLDEKSPTNWLLLTYVPKTNKLKVLDTSTGNWDDLCEELSDGKIFYGLCRFKVKEIFRYVYISWCGEGVQGVAAGSYNNHALFLQRVFRPYHVHINARNEQDLNEKDVVAKLSTALGAQYDAGQVVQGVQGRDANAGTPKTVTKTDAGVIDQKASSAYWEKNSANSGGPASGYKKDLDFQKASGAGSLKNRFEQLAEEQRPEAAPQRSAPPKQIKLDIAKTPAVVESTPAPSQVSYDNNYGGASYEDQGYEEPYEQDTGATYEEPAPYDEGGYEEGGYEEGGYEEGGYEEGGYEEGYSDGVYASALYDYEGADPSDLVFKAGDSILVLDQSDPSGWWKGQLGDAVGYFPSNFVQLN